MIIDAHAHAFPHFAGPKSYLSQQQDNMRGKWGSREQSTRDEKYIPEPGEDVGFRVGKYGKLYWTKHDKECWMRRFPNIMVEMEWPPEHMIEFMDAAGVDKAVLQAGYMDPNYVLEYFADCMKRFPGRFIGTVNSDYDIEKSEEYREAELKKLRDYANKMNMRGIFQGYPREQDITDEKFEPFWEEISRLKMVHLFRTGQGQTKKKYLEFLDQIENVLKKYPGVNAFIIHLGGNIKPPSDPNFTDTPKEFMNILRLPNAYFEVGCVLKYESWDVWKENYEYPYPLHTKIAKRIYDEVGAEKLVWGSDMPNTYRTCTYQQNLDLVRLHFDFLSEKEKSLVLGGNAAKLFRV